MSVPYTSRNKYRMRWGRFITISFMIIRQSTLRLAVFFRINYLESCKRSPDYIFCSFLFFCFLLMSLVQIWFLARKDKKYEKMPIQVSITHLFSNSIKEHEVIAVDQFCMMQDFRMLLTYKKITNVKYYLTDYIDSLFTDEVLSYDCKLFTFSFQNNFVFTKLKNYQTRVISIRINEHSSYTKIDYSLKASYQNIQTGVLKEMQTFTYWHAYFDSIFLKPSPKLSFTFIKDMQLQRVLQGQWTKCSFLPELNILLQFLQNFIKNTSWKHTNCSQLQMKRIESNLNNLLSIIQGQKLYGRQYWRESQRRVQASIVHHFIYLKMLILAIIPDSCRSLSQALINKKLCIQINKIEDLINNYLANLRPLYAFLHRSKFLQQKSLIGELFQSITKFWQSLPQMARSELQQVPKIMRYICLNNPLDSLRQTFDSSKLLQIRKKSETIQDGKGNRKNKRYETCFDRKSDILLSKENSYERKHYDSSGKTQSKHFNDQKKENKKTFFKFKKEILQNTHSVSQILQKTNTIISQESIKNRPSPVKQLDRFRSTTFVPQQFNSELKAKNNVNNSRLTIQKPRLRDRLVTKSAFSDLSIQRHKIFLQKCEEQEIERRAAKKGNQGGKCKIKFNMLSSIHLQTGKAKGWALIRQNVNEKIVRKKLEKLHQS